MADEAARASRFDVLEGSRTSVVAVAVVVVADEYPLPRNFRKARVDGQARRSESKHGAAEGASPTRATTARLPVGGARRDSNANR